MASKYAFSKGLKELRFHFCHTSEASAGLKQFLKSSYPTMKKHNPETPMLIREAFGVKPVVWARYEHGRETKTSVDGLSATEVEKAVQGLAQS
ncbi:hypothetical protein PYCC9005_000176 [Savitreella phatthalungensis]